MEATTIQKHIHTSPRKLKLVADMVRKMRPASALRTLKFTNKTAATPMAKAIETVLANAKQQNLVAEKLSFARIEINEGPAGRRFRAGTRGRAKPYKKRTSHIKIVLTDEVKEPENQINRINQKISESVEPENRNTDAPILSDLSEKDAKEAK